MSTALVVVDIQKDFVEGGSLGVTGGLKVAENVHDYIRGMEVGGGYKKIVATKDWHNGATDNDGHFSDTPDFVNSWPKHCVASAGGSEFAGPLNASDFDDIFHKGWNCNAYSGFEGKSVYNRTTSLGSYLKFYAIDSIDVVGIATDYCVKATVLDALDMGFKVTVLSDMTAAVADHDGALDEMRSAGATIL